MDKEKSGTVICHPGLSDSSWVTSKRLWAGQRRPNTAEDPYLGSEMHPSVAVTALQWLDICPVIFRELKGGLCSVVEGQEVRTGLWFILSHRGSMLSAPYLEPWGRGILSTGLWSLYWGECSERHHSGRPKYNYCHQGRILSTTEGLRTTLIDTVLILGLKRKLDSMGWDVCSLYGFRIPRQSLLGGGSKEKR